MYVVCGANLNWQKAPHPRYVRAALALATAQRAPTLCAAGRKSWREQAMSDASEGNDRMLTSIVLVKQVPDTANISGKVMNDDGTVNRAKLPAVFNTEDRSALELALQTRDEYGGRVLAVTMGPPRASDVLRECLYMGVDAAYLVSDRRFAGADTLATSYVLAQTIRRFAPFDLVFAGRQAIDGDTAQVGPQTAEKLGIAQITYTEAILGISDTVVTAKRKIDGGYEILRAQLPVLLTVIKDAAAPRPYSAKRLMAFKNARTLIELEKMVEENSLLYLDRLVEEHRRRNLFIDTITADDLEIQPEQCGLRGSPTRVYKIESVVLSGRERQNIEPTRSGLRKLVEGLVHDRIFG
jgi:electron transfer flavoprotein beta subunit